MARATVRLMGMGVLIGVLAGLSGCGGEVKETENMLSAAGFQMKTAETPQQVEHLESMPQHKLLRHEKDGKPVFIYADAKYCDCMYVGDEAARQRYEKMAVEKQIADEQMMAAEDYEMDWGPWGPWGP
ncbi:MAG TPA: hypothetical protein P5279_08130 [Anaerohalosphaeraceae bacterium]|jgi:Rieske Fe-S protein|nr:hypothetical protein [Anaerohalosphaeraceae bacterium]HRT50443.1 hypothetical protein [Anaerohalosphaeraceae bacterium]HRT86373.1 hypothetical protein [Anaerohalosphaeraceae bacterium]